jgi:hypoxanthine phosphoribosyltransferase
MNAARPPKQKPRTKTATAPRARSSSTAARPRPAKTARPAEQPLGVGVADAFALKRLQIPQEHARPAKPVRDLGWAEFGEVAKTLSDRIAADFQPDVVLGVVNGGVFIGGALAAPFRAEFRAVRVEREGRRRIVREPVATLKGKTVLVVDDVAMSGDTLAAAATAARKAGAREVRTATLVVRPDGHHPDYHAIETNEIVVFGWDYGLDSSGGPGGADPGEVGV